MQGRSPRTVAICARACPCSAWVPEHARVLRPARACTRRIWARARATQVHMYHDVLARVCSSVSCSPVLTHSGLLTRTRELTCTLAASCMLSAHVYSSMFVCACLRLHAFWHASGWCTHATTEISLRYRVLRCVYTCTRPWHARTHLCVRTCGAYLFTHGHMCRARPRTRIFLGFDLVTCPPSGTVTRARSPVWVCVFTYAHVPANVSPCSGVFMHVHTCTRSGPASPLGSAVPL